MATDHVIRSEEQLHDLPGFVKVVDDTTLAVPDRPGNTRLRA